MKQDLHPWKEACLVHQLANGLTVLIEPLPHVRSVTMGVWAKTGSANETAEQSGISHCLEHLFFRGTSTRRARELMEQIERRGGHMNAFTSRDFTCVYVKTLDRHASPCMEILADVVKNSQLCDFEKERGIILEEIASIEDVPEDHIQDLFFQMLWPDHALGRPVSGSEESVSQLSVDDVRTYYKQWYQPNELLVSIAGHVEPAALLEQLRAEFEDLAPRQNNRSERPPLFRPGLATVEKDIAQTHLCFGFPSPGMDDDRRYVYDMLTSAIGGGSTSRLFSRIREREGLAYSVYSFYSCFRLAGLLGVYVAIAPENLHKTLDIIFEEVRRLRHQPLSPDEMEINREQLKSSLLMGLESTSGRMGRIAKSMIYHGRILGVDEVLNAIDAVTAEDVHQASHDTFVRDQCALIILGPTDGRAIHQVPL